MTTDVPDDLIPDRELIASYYVGGRIDEGAVVQDDNWKVRFIGHGMSGEAWWDPYRGLWLWRYEPWCCQVCFQRARCDGLYRFRAYGLEPEKLD